MCLPFSSLSCGWLGRVPSCGFGRALDALFSLVYPLSPSLWVASTFILACKWLHHVGGVGYFRGGGSFGSSHADPEETFAFPEPGIPTLPLQAVPIPAPRHLLEEEMAELSDRRAIHPPAKCVPNLLTAFRPPRICGAGCELAWTPKTMLPRRLRSAIRICRVSAPKNPLKSHRMTKACLQESGSTTLLGVASGQGGALSLPRVFCCLRGAWGP